MIQDTVTTKVMKCSEISIIILHYSSLLWLGLKLSLVFLIYSRCLLFEQPASLTLGGLARPEDRGLICAEHTSPTWSLCGLGPFTSGSSPHFPNKRQRMKLWLTRFVHRHMKVSLILKSFPKFDLDLADYWQATGRRLSQCTFNSDYILKYYEEQLVFYREQLTITISCLRYWYTLSENACTKDTNTQILKIILHFSNKQECSDNQ